MSELELDSLEIVRESQEISVGKGTSFTLDKSWEDARVLPFLDKILVLDTSSTRVYMFVSNQNTVFGSALFLFWNGYALDYMGNP